MKHPLMGNRGTVINSVKNLQRKFNRQHRRMEQWARENQQPTTLTPGDG